MAHKIRYIPCAGCGIIIIKSKNKGSNQYCVDCVIARTTQHMIKLNMVKLSIAIKKGMK